MTSPSKKWKYYELMEVKYVKEKEDKNNYLNKSELFAVKK